MKKLTNKFAIITILGIMLFSLNLFAATRASGVGSSPGVLSGDHGGFEIIAGQHIRVGWGEIWSDEDYTYVVYILGRDWFLTETHLHLARDWREIPQTKTGNPIPGRFDYQMEHNYVNYYLYQIPRTEWKYGAAHCVVVKMENGKPVQEETGWGRDKGPPRGEFPGRNWAWYFEHRY